MSAALEGDSDNGRLAWMPAHCSKRSFVGKYLSDGSAMTDIDRRGSDCVDRLAKDAAKLDKLTQSQMYSISQVYDEVYAVALWLGQIGALANHYPLPHTRSNNKVLYVRDSEGLAATQYRRRVAASKKRKAVTQADPPGFLSQCDRWLQLLQRIRDKEAASISEGA